MIRRTLVPSMSATMALVLALSPGCVPLDGGSVAVVGGQRKLAESEFERLDSPTFFGVEGVARPSSFPLDLELGLYHHREDGVLPVTGQTEVTGTELAFGVRKTFDLDQLSLHPYVGIGLSVFYTDRDNQFSPIVGEEGSDFDTGFYFRTGLDWFLSEQFFIGGDVRWIQESNFDYGGYDLDGPAFTLRAGWSF